MGPFILWVIVSSLAAASAYDRIMPITVNEKNPKGNKLDSVKFSFSIFAFLIIGYAGYIYNQNALRAQANATLVAIENRI